MKKYIIFFSIVSLIITTSIVKSSTRQLEKNIFTLEEEVKILEEKFNFLILENDYLTTPERLIRLKEKIFKDQFFPIDPRDIKKIENNAKSVVTEVKIVLDKVSLIDLFVKSKIFKSLYFLRLSRTLSKITTVSFIE